jgi:hypothetical protein
LAFRKFRLPHPSSPKKWKSLFSTCSPFGGAYAMPSSISVNIALVDEHQSLAD